MSVTHYRCASEVIAFTLFIQHKNAFHETMKKGEKTGEKKTIPKEMQTKAFFFFKCMVAMEFFLAKYSFQEIRDVDFKK